MISINVQGKKNIKQEIKTLFELAQIVKPQDHMKEYWTEKAVERFAQHVWRELNPSNRAKIGTEQALIDYLLGRSENAAKVDSSEIMSEAEASEAIAA